MSGMNWLDGYFFVQCAIVIRRRNGCFIIIVQGVGMLCSRRGVRYGNFFWVLAECHSDFGFGMWGDVEMLNPYHVLLGVGLNVYHKA